VAAQLAEAIKAQWLEEAAVRRLNASYLLAVSWVPADQSLADSWDVLVSLATGGAGWPVPQRPGIWALGPGGLGGDGGDLVKVLRRVPTGRLAVLGEPGSGKSVLMVRLVLDLLNTRGDADAVPVLTSIASWNPGRQGLREWMAAQLLLDYPALAVPGPRGAKTLADALLAAGLIMPVLDGLDEIPQNLRGSAVTRINDAVRPGEGIVVTCRTAQYEQAVTLPGGTKAPLAGAAAVRLCSLDADTVARYLHGGSANPVQAARWAPVVAALGTQAPAGQALTTPLMVGLALTIYHPRAGEAPGRVPDPAELCSPALTDRGAVEAHLFDGLVPAAYSPGQPGTWTAQEAATWLEFLARHLETRIHDPDLAWWELTRAVHLRLLRLGVAATVGLITAIVAWAVNGSTAAAWFGLLPAFALALTILARRPRQPSRGIRLRPVRFTAALLVALAPFALGAVLLFHEASQETPATSWTGLWADLGEALFIAFLAIVVLVAGLAIALTLALSIGLQAMPGDLRSAPSPYETLARDRRATLILGGAVLSGVTAIFTLASGLALHSPALGLVVGAPSGLLIALIVGTTKAAWPSYTLARIWLALRHRLPWRLMDFLADAHRRGILRQEGAVYHFRHMELQHHLANRYRRHDRP
jgi:hypothetical protein